MHSSVLRMLAAVFVAGDPSVEQVNLRIIRTLRNPYRWIAPLAQRYVEAMAGKTRPRCRDVIRFLQHDEGFQRAWAKYGDEFSVAQWLTGPPQMQPVSAAITWNVPAFDSPFSLAEWLGLTVGEVFWFADFKGLGHQSNHLGHYYYRILAKASGHIRLIEAPKHRLKDLQRQILFRILDRIPSHPSVHGFVKGRSIKTFVAPHVGKRVVVRMDLHDFFPSFARARVQAFFRTVGYPEAVADLLGGICTTATPGKVWKALPSADPRHRSDPRMLYARPHLPQGAPTSPALANICSFHLDCRLAGLAKSADAIYSRYADDLAFSGGEDFVRNAERFSIHVAAIFREEGFRVHHRKTRVMRQSVRQHLAGLVANQRLNIRRGDFDRLKAILTNCVRFGAESQNREAHPQFRSHLQGRVAFMENVNPTKGKRLRAIFERIRWVPPVPPKA